MAITHFPCQKKTQLDLDQHEHLHDVTCCWLYVRAYMEKVFPGDIISKHDEMWEKGFLGTSCPWRQAPRWPAKSGLARKTVIDSADIWLTCD